MKINDPKGIDNNHQISSLETNKIDTLETKGKASSPIMDKTTGENKVYRDFNDCESHSDRLEKIKKQIESGEYNISSASIAKKMLANMEDQRGRND